MTRFCFTVDLDRDVNIPVPGRRAAGSIDRGGGCAPRFASTLSGLELLVGLLDEMGMPCTFFCEGRTMEMIRDHAGLLDGFEIGLHGYDHEDMSGLTRQEAVGVLEDGISAIRDATGRTPVCFRAPYMRPPDDLAHMLPQVGIRMDSSLYQDISDAYPVTEGGISRLPVSEGRDARGRKISGYLWPMHEGKRRPQDYIRLAESTPDGGTCVFGDHTWHLCESRDRGIMDAGEASGTAQDVREVLGGVLDAGLRPVTVSRVLERWRNQPDVRDYIGVPYCRLRRLG